MQRRGSKDVDESAFGTPANLDSHTFEQVALARGQKWADDKLANGSWNPSYGAIAVGLASLPQAQSVLAALAHPNGQS